MSKSTSMTRTGLLAVLMAMVGFSYSLATSLTEDAPEAGPSPRAVGTTIPLDFANPFVAGPGSDRDLGDAVAGSAITRLVRAKGGVPPYSFTAGTLATALKLLTNGILTGTLPAGTTTLPSPYRFAVTVKDSFGTANPHTDTETFRLTFVSSTQFRFAKSQLSDGNFFRQYSDSIDVINGRAPFVFTASNVVFTPNVGVPIPLTSLEKAGLSLSKDGAVFGVPLPQGATTNPLNGGVLSFTATATDATTAKAANRQGVGTSQTISLNIGANVIVQSTVITTKMTIKANVPGKDSIQWSGIANLNGAAISALNGLNFNFRVGPYAAPTVIFDTKGNAKSARGVTPVVAGKVKKGGVSTFKVTKESIALGTITGSTIDLAVETRVGDAIIGSEILRFSVKISNNGTATLTYKGAPGSDVGGAGQLTKVQGTDDKGGIGDSWKATFLARIPTGSDISGSNQVVINIGTSYTSTTTLTAKNTKLTGVKGDKKLPVIAAFSYDSKTGKGTYTTGPLPTIGANSTGLKQAIASTVKDNFSTGIFFRNANADILGIESALAIFPKRTKWSEVNPVK